MSHRYDLIEATFLRALAEHGQSAAASATGVSESRLSRWKNADSSQGGGLLLREVAALIDELGLYLGRATDADVVVVSRDDYEAIKTLARRALA